MHPSVLINHFRVAFQYILLFTFKPYFNDLYDPLLRFLAYSLSLLINITITATDSRFISSKIEGSMVEGIQDHVGHAVKLRGYLSATSAAGGGRHSPVDPSKPHSTFYILQ